MTEEQEQDSQKIKALLDAMKSSDCYKVKTLDNGEINLSLDKKTGYIWIIHAFKGEYSMDFLTDYVIRGIMEIVSDGEE